eukprot:2805900-Lingulodinium_polyedra.AAC.1
MGCGGCGRGPPHAAGAVGAAGGANGARTELPDGAGEFVPGRGVPGPRSGLAPCLVVVLLR